MLYYSRPGEDNVDEFDPTPYGGGCDIVLTYGRPLEPCKETCYPSSTPSGGDFDYARPHFSSGSEPSAYADEAFQTGYSSYARPKPRPPPAYSDWPGAYEAAKEPGNGRRPEYEQSDPGYGRKPEFERPGSEFESGCGRMPEFEQPPPPEFGSGYGRRPEHKQPPLSEFGSGYERRPEYEQPPPSEFGSRYGPRPEYGEQESEYWRKSGYRESESEYGSGYGRKAESEGGGSEYGTRHGWRNEDEHGSGYGDRTESGHGYGYAKKQSYGSEEYGRERTEFEWKLSYWISEEEEEGFGKPRYGRKYDDSDDKKRKSYGYGGEKGYGRKKYEDMSTLFLSLAKCVEETSKVLAKVLNGEWFKAGLVLFLLFTSGLRGVRSEDIGDPLIPGSTGMNAVLANKNLRGLTLSERRQMLGTETSTINYHDFPRGNSPPNKPASEQANPYQRACNIESQCRQGSKGKKN